jgi:hypothetical protein
MSFNAEVILSVLDRCCDTFTFPMLDNGYVYPAGTRLVLYRSMTDWAMVIEVFGFSPRAGLPDTCIHTFASRLHNRDSPDSYANRGAYERYLANHPNNDSRFIFPVNEGLWQDRENEEFVAEDATEVLVRMHPIPIPTVNEYVRHRIELEQPPRVQVFELCRFLADVARDQVLATPPERRVSVLPNMEQILQLEEWHHPNVVDDNERPSKSETFQQLAHVLAAGDLGMYHPSQPPNSHWTNWPGGGRL